MLKIKWVLMLFILFGLLISPDRNSTIYASKPTEVEVVFVIDTSFSMNTTDEERISTEVMNLFMDLNENSQTKVGFVFYNDKIVDSQPLISLEEVKDKSILKERLNSIPRTGYTDQGLGLHKGQELFQNNNIPETKRAMILLTDGEIDLPKHSKRTKEEVENDITQVIVKAKQDQYPIYTVRLNSSGNLNNKQLEHIAVETGGAFFKANDAEALLEIFKSIFANLGPLTHFPIETVSATGMVQEVHINIPFEMSEGTILLLSKNPFEKTALDGQAIISKQQQSNHYTILNLKEIKEKSLRLTFKSTKGNKVSVSFLGDPNISASLELPKGGIVKDKPILFRTILVKNGDSNPIKLSADFDGELIIKHLESGTEKQFPLVNTGTSFEIEQAFSKLGTYEVNALISGEDFHVETAPKTFELVNSQPFLVKSESITIKKWNEDKIINLNEYFSDPNQDNLTFEINKIGNEEKVTATINGNLLVLTPVEKGETTIDLHVIDHAGRSMVSTLHISVENEWYVMYIIIGIASSLLFIGLIFFWFIRKKNSFVGRIEAVFYQTEGNSFHSRKYWPLTAFNNRKRITLAELFSRLDIQEDLPGAKLIIFQAGRHGVLTFKHDTKCIIMKNGSIIPRKQKEVIKNNEKLLITFEDGKIEVELLYKATEQYETMESYSYSG